MRRKPRKPKTPKQKRMSKNIFSGKAKKQKKGPKKDSFYENIKVLARLPNFVTVFLV